MNSTNPCLCVLGDWQTVFIYYVGSSKLCSAHSSYLFSSPRMAMVRVVVWKLNEIESQNYWSMQQPHDKGTEASGK